MKPFDCVGTFEESRQALEIIKNKKKVNLTFLKSYETRSTKKYKNPYFRLW